MTAAQSKLIFVLGGARAGKSSFAVQAAKERAADGRVCFIATAQALDDEMATRISRHQAERPESWNTIEEPYQLDDALLRAGDANAVIVDCLTLFVSNWLLRSDDENQCEETLRKIVGDFLATVKRESRAVICVSNEVGLGVVPGNRLSRNFCDLLGRVNQQFAATADEVYLLVAGLRVQIKP